MISGSRSSWQVGQGVQDRFGLLHLHPAGCQGGAGLVVTFQTQRRAAWPGAPPLGWCGCCGRASSPLRWHRCCWRSRSGRRARGAGSPARPSWAFAAWTSSMAAVVSVASHRPQRHPGQGRYLSSERAAPGVKTGCGWWAIAVMGPIPAPPTDTALGAAIPLWTRGSGTLKRCGRRKKKGKAFQRALPWARQARSGGGRVRQPRVAVLSTRPTTVEPRAARSRVSHLRQLGPAVGPPAGDPIASLPLTLAGAVNPPRNCDEGARA